MAIGIEDIDIWRTAKILMDAHGENAKFHAAMRADNALDDGNRDTVNVWMSVIRAIEALEMKILPKGQRAH